MPTLPIDPQPSTSSEIPDDYAPVSQTTLKYKVMKANSDGTVDVTQTTVQEDVFENPANVSIASTVRTVTAETHTEQPDYVFIPKFKQCTREQDTTRCDLCEQYSDHGGCKARNQGGCPLNCCRQYMDNPDYTRKITPENSGDETSLEIEDDDYHSTDEITTDDDDDEELDEIEEQHNDDFYKSSDTHNNPSPAQTEEEANQEEEEFLLARQKFKQSFPLDVSDDISPNAISTADEEDERSDTPRVNNDVLKLSLETETPNEQDMEVDTKKRVDTPNLFLAC